MKIIFSEELPSGRAGADGAAGTGDCGRAGEGLTHGQRVLSRARSLMAHGKARGWSHAIDLAAQTLEPTPAKPPKRPKATHS